MCQKRQNSSFWPKISYKHFWSIAIGAGYAAFASFDHICVRGVADRQTDKKVTIVVLCVYAKLDKMNV